MSPSKTLFFGQSLVRSDVPKIWSPKRPPPPSAPVDRSERSFPQPRGLNFGTGARAITPAPSRKLSIREWTVDTEQDCELCSSAFLSLCFLLSMADPHQELYTLDRPVSQLPSNQCIFAREPTSHFWVEVLAPLQSPQAPMLVLKSAHAYVTGLLSHLRVHDAASLYSAAFFTAANLHLCLAVDTWNMSATSRAGD
jgi:hypothetical protein